MRRTRAARPRARRPRLRRRAQPPPGRLPGGHIESRLRNGDPRLSRLPPFGQPQPRRPSSRRPRTRRLPALRTRTMHGMR
ncbi:MAG: hypothetical protein E6G24_11545 [Actinobacteria bacterium]|nr:MAG: hypothetical protein E6G24_11545 [Actinomycetota bacterium]